MSKLVSVIVPVYNGEKTLRKCVESIVRGRYANVEVILVGTDSVTIRDLPAGTYTVTEQSAWTWREAALSAQRVELTTQDETVTFDFGAIDRIYWLNGYGYQIKFAKGGF